MLSSICDDCKWYEYYNGVCFCGECEYCAGYPPYDLRDCKCFEEVTNDA